jgi:hypothetical protein
MDNFFLQDTGWLKNIFATKAEQLSVREDR